MIDEDESTARLLQLAGPRPHVPADRAARVRDAVHAEWRGAARRRLLRRRAALAAAGVAAASIAAGLAIVRRGDVAPPQAPVVAVVERLEGMSARQAQGPVRAGEWIDTGVAARLTLRLPDGSSVRLDSSSRVRVLTPAALELASGRMYIDTGPASNGLEVRTRLGVVRDIGTQFETQLAGDALHVRVRTGIVELRRERRDPVHARAGTELTLANDAITTRDVPRFGPAWAWASALAPPFAIEGRSVAALLEHMAREHGWSLRYADAALARDASGIILHGSVEGLEPDDALAAALATSGLVHRVRDGELLVSRGATPREIP